MDAKRDVTVGVGQDASGSDYSKKVKGVGLTWSSGGGGFSVGAGYHASSQVSSYDRVSVAPSIITGVKGVDVTAGRDITMVAARVVSDAHVGMDAGRHLSLLAGANKETSYQSSKEMFAGITLKVSQNVTGAVEQLKAAPGTFASGYGGGAYQAIGMASGVMQAVDGLKSLSNPTVSASLMLGANGSKSQSGMQAVTAVPTTITAGSASLKSGSGDLHLVGTQVKVKHDLVLDAGRNLVVESAQSYAQSSSSSSSWNAGVGVSGSLGVSGGSLGIGIEGGFARDKSTFILLEVLRNPHLPAALLRTSEVTTTLASSPWKLSTVAARIDCNALDLKTFGVSFWSSSKPSRAKSDSSRSLMLIVIDL